MSARATFERCRAYALELESLHRELRALQECQEACLSPRRRRAGGRTTAGGNSDPTASAAMELEATTERRIDEVRGMIAEAERYVGMVGAYVEHSREQGYGPWADVMELRFIGCMEWVDVAEACGISVRTAERRAVQFCEWADQDHALPSFW